MPRAKFRKFRSKMNKINCDDTRCNYFNKSENIIIAMRCITTWSWN